MKKSKVIIPAMALLLFSTAASITGTVAWFTATRVFATQASTFAVNSIDGNLKAKVYGRVGTEALDSAGSSATGTGDTYNGVKVQNARKTISNVSHVARLTHGSFDHTTTNAWILNPDGVDAVGSTNKFLDLDPEATANTAENGGGENQGYTKSKWYRGTQTVSEVKYDYFVAFSWHIDFEYTLGGDESRIGIFLDTKNSSIVASNTPVQAADPNNSYLTQNGFRIAFYPVSVSNSTETLDSTTTKARIFSKDDTVANAHYVNGAGYGADTNTYTATSDTVGNYNWQDSRERRAEGTLSAAAITGYPDLINIVAKAGSETKVTQRVICVAWYDGTDNDVVSGAQMDEVTTTLNFYVRSLTA